MSSKQLPWFKLFFECRTDRKLASLSDQEFRVWFNLLCYASEQETRGQIIYDDDFTLAVEVSNGDCELLMVTIEKLTKLRIVTSVTSCNELKRVEFIHYAERQERKTYPSDEPERVSERVKKHRSNECNESVTSVTSTERVDQESNQESESDLHIESDQRIVLIDSSSDEAKRKTIIRNLESLMVNQMTNRTYETIGKVIDDYGLDKILETTILMTKQQTYIENPIGYLIKSASGKNGQTYKPEVLSSTGRKQI